MPLAPRLARTLQSDRRNKAVIRSEHKAKPGMASGARHKIWLSLGSPGSFLQRVPRDGVQVSRGRGTLVLKGTWSPSETGGSHASCYSSQFLGPGRWGQESCVREMGRPPTFQAQELGGEGQLCHLNAKWLVCIFIQQTFITPLQCTEYYSRCWG